MSIRQQLAWLILGPGLLLVSTARLRGQETPAAPPPDAAAAAPGSVCSGKPTNSRRTA